MFARGGGPYNRETVTVLRVLSEPDRLDAPARGKLAEALTAAVLDVEVGGDNPVARRGIMVLFEDVERGRWAVGGRFDDEFATPGGRLLVMAQVMEGPWTRERRRALLERLAGALAGALGLDAAALASTWVLLQEIDEGSWGAFGGAISILDLVEPAGFAAEQRGDIERRVPRTPR